MFVGFVKRVVFGGFKLYNYTKKLHIAPQEGTTTYSIWGLKMIGVTSLHHDIPKIRSKRVNDFAFATS